jgi:23S rRNA pseudouridine2605 synthase
MSRQRAIETTAARKVTVNGKPISNPEFRIHPALDEVRIEGHPVSAPSLTYVALNKPIEVVTTSHDPEGRPTVYDFLPADSGWLAPVGRLDKQTSGLLLLTNDTAFAERVTSPTRKVPKTYLVKVSGFVSQATIALLSTGVMLDDGYKTLPAKVSEVRHNKGSSWLQFVVSEGKNRQVRRMCEAAGLRVMQLIRTRIGGLELGGLPKGKWKHLSQAEIEAIFSGE